MFGHLFKYGMKSLVRAKEIVFWSLVFPFALATFMYLAFGGIFEATEEFRAIPVAVVRTGENAVLEQMLTALSAEGDGQILDMRMAEEDAANSLLLEKEVDGVIYLGEKSRLKVRENGMDETILQMILQQVGQGERAIREVAAVHPERVMQAVAAISDEVTFTVRDNYGSGNQDNVVNYFYAIFAMTCLFASFASCGLICKVQADVSDIGLRRNVTPTHKMTIILTEFLVSESMQFVLSALLFVYLKFVLRIDIGDKYGCILLLLFLGTSLGTTVGILIGSLPRLGEGIKIGILVSLSLFLCACSDLMIQGVRSFFERHMPIVNDVNPAALICDSFYALNVYDTYGRFAGNMLALAAMTVLFMIVSFLMVRRSRYASL